MVLHVTVTVEPASRFLTARFTNFVNFGNASVLLVTVVDSGLSGGVMIGGLTTGGLPTGGDTGRAWICTVRLAEAAFPTASVAVTVTVYAPGPPNVCRTTLPGAGALPSPKVHVVDAELQRSNGDTENPRLSPAVPPPGTESERNSGGVASKPATCVEYVLVDVVDSRRDGA